MKDRVYVHLEGPVMQLASGMALIMAVVFPTNRAISLTNTDTCSGHAVEFSRVSWEGSMLSLLLHTHESPENLSPGQELALVHSHP